MDIGKQRRIIIVEPEPRVAPTPESAERAPESIPAPAEPVPVSVGASAA